ncbi:MAG: WbqC family protein [Oscillospiraceae bacterium]|nr:WbqC family protein [Oscillospiraceae bacterium]
MKSVAMLQSNYIPWKGVFDLIHRVDVFVFYDDVQFTKRDWRNRNRIPTANGEIWLTVPVLTGGKRAQLICETAIDADANWQQKHYKTLTLNYAKAPFLDSFNQLLQDFYLDNRWENLSEMNIYMTKYICEILGIKTEFVNAKDLNAAGSKDGEKVIKICKTLGCERFINGPSSRAFMDEEKFRTAGVKLEYMKYEYPEYSQLYPPFNHQVSVLDLLFMTGPDAPRYIFDLESNQ